MLAGVDCSLNFVRHDDMDMVICDEGLLRRM